MSTKMIAVDYKFGFVPTDERFNPLIIVEEWNDGEYTGDIRFHYENLDMIIHHLEGIRMHPNLFKEINGA